jgi:hypothetical protein
MCCLITVAVLLGPRLGVFLWWLFDMVRWERTFDSVLWPILGFVFLPWTTLAYVLVFPGGVSGIDWLLVVLAALIDLSSYSGSGYGNRVFWRR